jgi:hypothetical protein
MKKVGCVRTVGGAGVFERLVAALPVRPSAATRTMAKARMVNAAGTPGTGRG